MSEKKIKRTVIRLAMLGDSSVGKTSIINTFLDIEFSDVKLTTIGKDKMETKMKMKDGKEIKLIIWDTAGQERFHSMATSVIKGSQGVAVTFDLTKQSTFESVNNWLAEIKNNADSIPIVLFGNKCDILDKREVSEELVKNYAKDNNLIYFETSAKENINIKEGFQKLAEDAYEKSTGENTLDLKNHKNKKNKKC